VADGSSLLWRVRPWMWKAVERAKSALPPDPAKISRCLPLAVRIALHLPVQRQLQAKKINQSPHRISNIEFRTTAKTTPHRDTGQQRVNMKVRETQLCHPIPGSTIIANTHAQQPDQGP
jgi:hypothetical protein